MNKISSSRAVNLNKAESWRMFDDIAASYDRLNWMMTFGQERRWRRNLAKLLPPGKHLQILDLASGTGDIILHIFKENPQITRAYGLDLSRKMLLIAQQKMKAEGIGEKVILINANALKIPFRKGHFDVVTIGFGIRNTPDPEKVIQECFRVLKPAGSLLILESSQPENPVFRFLFRIYLRGFIPLIGKIVSRHRWAYEYFVQTTLAFPCGEKFLALLGKEGFQELRRYPQLGGAVTIYQGIKNAK